MSFIMDIADWFGISKKKDRQEEMVTQSAASVDALKDFVDYMKNKDYLDNQGVNTSRDSDPDTPLCTMAKLKKIYRDETVQSALEFMTSICMEMVGLYSYQNEDPGKQQLVNDSIENMSGSAYEYLHELMKLGIFYGFSALQNPYQVLDNKYLWGWMASYDSDDIEFQMSRTDKGKEFISHLKIRGGDPVSSRNFIIYSHGSLTNPYGFGRGNMIEKWYDLKINSLKYWAMFLQKYVFPTLVGKSHATKVNSLFNRLLSWTYNNVICLIKDQEEVEILERKAGLATSEEFVKAIEFSNKMIFRVFFLLSLLAEGEGGGSYALGDKHFEMLLLACRKIAEDFRDGVLISQCVARLIDWNYGRQNKKSDYGQFIPKESLDIEKRNILADIFLKAVNIGVIDPAEMKDIQFIRESLEFPKIDEEKVNEIMDKLKKKVDRAEKEDNIPATIPPEEIKQEDEVIANENTRTN